MTRTLLRQHSQVRGATELADNSSGTTVVSRGLIQSTRVNQVPVAVARIAAK